MTGRLQKAARRMGTHAMVEALLALGFGEPVGAGALGIRPPGGQVVGRRKLVENDGAIPCDGADQAMPRRTHRVDEKAETVGGQNAIGRHRRRHGREDTTLNHRSH